MEREKKQALAREKQPKSVLETQGHGAPAVQRSVAAPRPSMVAVADALFDLHMDEKQGSRTNLLPSVLSTLPGLEQLVAIVGACLIPGCDVHLLSREQGVGALEGGGLGIGFKILTHLEAASPIQGNLVRARNYWASPDPAAVAVLVYTDSAGVLMADGTEVPLR